MAALISHRLKEIASRHLELGAKGSLLFKAPVGAVLRAIHLDRSEITHNIYVHYVIMPLHCPTRGTYFQDGPQAGFKGQNRLWPLENTSWDMNSAEHVAFLEETVMTKLMPEWERLSDISNCIELLTSFPQYKYKRDQYIAESLVYLTAYQHDFDRCIQFIQEYKQHYPVNEVPRVNLDYFPESYWQRIELVEECIKSDNISLLDQKLDVWYESCVKSLGLSLYAREKIQHDLVD